MIHYLIVALSVALGGFSPTQAKVDYCGELNLRSGDIIFQSSKSNQSTAIMWASKSLYSHVGLIEKKRGKCVVIEALSKVSETPLEKWIDRGRFSRFSVFRLPSLNEEQLRVIMNSANSMLGMEYDSHFTSANNGKKEYCSRLISNAYKSAKIKLGLWQKVGDLDINNIVVKSLFKKRFRSHPLCKIKSITYEKCWKEVIDDPILTPDGLSRDPNLKIIFTNYPFKFSSNTVKPNLD